MKIWAMPAPISSNMGEEEIKELTTFIASSLKRGVSRYGWYEEDMSKYKRTKEDIKEMIKHFKFYIARGQHLNPIRFLQKVNIGDWVVHINVPKIGFCTAAQVIGKYEENDSHKLYSYNLRHTLKIDTTTLVEFNRNSPAVLPKISNQLKYRGNQWSVNDTSAFLESINNLNIDTADEIEKDRTYYLKNAITPSLESIAEKINAYYPKEDLKYLMVKVFQAMPDVSNVVLKNNIHNSNYEKDLYITYKTDGTATPLTQMVLINVYEKDDFEISIKEPILNAIETYNIETALVIDINNNTPNLKKNISKLSAANNKQIDLLAGVDVIRFIIKQCPELLQ